MDAKEIVIRRESDGDVAASGKLINELYVLNLRIIKPKQSAQVNLSTTTETLKVYHEWLAHQNKRHVKQALKRMGVDAADGNEQFCDGCALGKIHLLPFKHRKNRATVVGELIHAYVNGPISTKSLDGARYYASNTISANIVTYSF
jgi:hypothetical protein